MTVGKDGIPEGHLFYSLVLEAQPETVLSRAAKTEVLSASCREAPAEDVARAVAGGPESSLLQLRLAVEDQRAAIPPAKRRRIALPEKQPGGRKVPRVAKLAAMLTEAAEKQKLQVAHEQALDAAAQTAAATAAQIESSNDRKKKDQADITAQCSACLDTLPLSALVVCPYFTVMKGNTEQTVRQFLRRRQAGPHVICAVCLRAYLLSIRMHGGDERKMVCPGCVASVQLLVRTEHHGQTLAQLSKRDWVEAEGPYPKQVVDSVLGPVDRLRMKDLKQLLKSPPPVAPETAKFLRSAGARVCPRCSTPHVKGSGCNAVMCELCSVVFNYSKAKRV